MIRPVEKLREIWSPDREVVEVVQSLDPTSTMDSLRADWLHRICEQKGPQTLVLGHGDTALLNTGTLRFEIVHHQPSPGVPGRRELTLWVEKGEPL